jgi:hypothetical protein
MKASHFEKQKNWTWKECLIWITLYHYSRACDEEEKTKTQENPTKQTKRDKNTGTDQDMQQTRRNQKYKTVKMVLLAI